jgi:hypothetical protein
MVLVGADANFFDPISNFVVDAFTSYGDLGPTLVPYNVTLRNTEFIYSTINREPACRTLVWPSEEIKRKAGFDAWGDWRPRAGMNASVLYGWGTGMKWLLHVVEDDKYLVVRDPVISNSWKQGKKYWFDHHVSPRDPRHADRITAKRQEQESKTAKTQAAAGGTCGGKLQGEMPPTWVLVVIVVLFCCIVYLGVTTIRGELAKPALQQNISGKASSHEEGEKGTRKEGEPHQQKKKQSKTQDQKKP